MKIALAILALAATLHAEPSRVLKLWDGKPPGDFTVPGPEKLTPANPADALPILRLTNVAEPRLEFYEPASDKKNGAAVVIVPGGGFGILASGHEGSDLAEWFRDRGFVAAVLEHRCPTNTLPKPWDFPAQDTQRALSLVRAKAADLGVQPDRIGLFGFSAGGQVALIATTNADARLYLSADAIDQVSCRPDFLMLCYPWKILADNSLTQLKPEIHISDKTPPTFLAQANDDPGSLAEGSTLAFLALRKAKVSAELHIYSTGGHGFGLHPNNTQAPGDWPGRAELWLQARGLLKNSAMPYVLIALGSALGGVLRYWLAGLTAKWFEALLGAPHSMAFLGTMFVNITGSFAIGFIAALGPVDFTRQLFMIGLLGGYTTFSSFSLQTLELAHEGRWLHAGGNVLLSVAFSLVAVWLGHLCGTAVRR